MKLLAVLLGVTFVASALGAALHFAGPALVERAPGAADAPIAWLEEAGRRILGQDVQSGHVALEWGDSAVVDGFLTARNLAPGDVTNGSLVLSTPSGVDARYYALSVHAEPRVDGHDGTGPRLDDHLLVTRFAYGGEELVRGPARNIVPVLDGHPGRGNGDGRVSLSELVTGVRGLPPPAAGSAGGTRLLIEVQFDPDVRGNGTAFRSQTVNVAFVFTLGPHSDADLSAPQVAVTGTRAIRTGDAAHVTFAFTKPMEPTSVAAALSGADAWTLTWDGNDTVLNATHVPPVAGTHVLTLADSAVDVYGIALTEGAAWHVDVTAPPPPPPPPLKENVTEALPGPPRDLKAEPGDALARLTWAPPADPGSASVTAYRVYVADAPGAWRFVAEVADPAHVVTGLAPWTPLTFRVTAVSAVGEGAPSDGVAITPTGAPSVTLTVTPEAPQGERGWYTEPPRVTLEPLPAFAEVRYRFGEGAPRTYTEPFAMPAGTHVLTVHAHVPEWGDGPEATRAFAVDPTPPAIADAGTSGTVATVNDTLTVRARVTDAESGVARVTARITLPDGGMRVLAMARSADVYSVTVPFAATGAYAFEVAAWDVAGHATRASAGVVRVDAESGGEVPDPLEPTSVDETPLADENAGNGPANGTRAPGAVDAGAENGSTQTAPVGIHVQPRNLSGIVAPGIVTGSVDVSVDYDGDPARLVLVAIAPDGSEVVLAEGAASAAWDTSAHANGYYRIETRERQEDGSYRVLASRGVLVRHASATPLEAVGAIAAGVVVVVASGPAFSGARHFPFLGALSAIGRKILAGLALQRQGWFLVLGKRRKELPPLRAGAWGLLVMTTFIALGAVTGWDWRAFMQRLPVTLLATGLLLLTVWLAEIRLARRMGDPARLRFDAHGAWALALTTLLFRQPFGSVGFVQSRGEDSGETRDSSRSRRAAALRALATLGVTVATPALFLPAGLLWRFDFAEVGISTALMIAAMTAIPVAPLNGHRVWQWSKPVAIAVAAGALLAYYAYETGVVPILALPALATAGLIGYGLAWWKLRAA